MIVVVTIDRKTGKEIKRYIKDSTNNKTSFDTFAKIMAEKMIKDIQEDRFKLDHHRQTTKNILFDTNRIQVNV